MNMNEYTIVWEENFDYEGSPTLEKWNFEVGNHQWPNKELQAYTARETNICVKNGQLSIYGQKEKDGDREYTSSKINTSKKSSWQYGYFEFRAKMPVGEGSWPAIWLMPEDWKIENEAKKNLANSHSKWPACGEIDMMEYVGRFPNHILFSLHCKNHNHADKSTKPLTKAVEFDFKPGDDFHVYGMEWTEDYIEYFVDGVSYCKYNKSDDPDQSLDSWPFCKPFYLIVNLAIGGGLGGPVDETTLPYIFTIDYIRVYQKKK